MKRTKHYLVTHIDPYLFPQPQDLEDKVLNGLGVWSATDEETLKTKWNSTCTHTHFAHLNLQTTDHIHSQHTNESKRSNQIRKVWYDS